MRIRGYRRSRSHTTAIPGMGVAPVASRFRTKKEERKIVGEQMELTGKPS